MDFIDEIEEMLLSSSSDDEDDHRMFVRREYSLFERKTADSFDDVDFHKYFRVTKDAFRRLHQLVGANLNGNPVR